MKEQIVWDFVSKARELAVSDTPDGGKCFDQDVFHNKFAELIVLECAKVAGDFEYARLHDSLVEDKIKEHFGVEE